MKLILKTTVLLYFLIFQFISNLSSQNLDTSYNNYFSLEREIPYLQLNKTAFLNGEEIWFKSYIYNFNKKKLNNNTKNLYVSVYHENGALKDRKLIYIKNGLGSGNIMIDSTYTDKAYYIKAHTNWMKNFKEDESYLQKINIIQNKKEEKLAYSDKYDIQFLPESGHLLASAENTVGVIVKDINNNGVQIKEGKILDEENNILVQFKNNLFGIGSFDFKFQEDKKYKAKITFFDGSEIEQPFLSAEKKGVVLSVYNPSTTFISVFIKTNKFTLPDLQNKEYTLYLHNAHTTLKQQITFNSEATEYNINFNARKLDAGINIITLFNENNKPIAERVFFNYNKDLFANPEISYNKFSYDSITVKINKSQNTNESFFLSASLLPEQTKSYQPTTNIISKFLLQPYIKGEIENPNFYFKDINRKKLNALDLLLLTQGWSKFKWNDIFNNLPKENFEFENGISIKGTINSKKEFKSVFLMSPQNGLMISAPVTNKKFEFNYLNLLENTDVNISVKKGNNIKKENIYLQYYPTSFNDKLEIPKTVPKFNVRLPEIDFSDFIDDRVNLNEIVITANEKKIKRNLGILGVAKSYKIDEASKKNQRILTFIRNQGFRVNEAYGEYSIYSGRGAISFLETKPTMVYLNGNLIQDDMGFNSLKQIEFLTLNDLEELIISKTAFGQIHLYTKAGQTYTSKNRFSENKVPFGYVAEKEYYQPAYASYTDDLFKNYGVVNWKPNIKIDSTATNTSFNTAVLGQKNMRLYIEGITSDGKLIFEEIQINLN